MTIMKIGQFEPLIYYDHDSINYIGLIFLITNFIYYCYYNYLKDFSHLRYYYGAALYLECIVQ